MDESLTAWIISEDFQTTFHRALNYQGQSPLYFIMIHAWSKIFGSTEWILRFFSLLCITSGSVFQYFLYRLKFSRELSLYGTLLGTSFLFMFTSVLEARPYGFVTAFLIASQYYFIVWLQTGSKKSQVLHLFCSVAIIYGHWLLGSILLVQSLLVLIACVVQKKVFLKKWISSLFFIGILSSPNLYQIIMVFRKRFVYNYIPEASLSTWINITFPLVPLLISLILISVLILQRDSAKKLSKNFNTIIVGICWFLVPSSIFFVVSKLFKASILSRLYLGSNYLGFVLIILSFFSCLENSRIRNLILIITSISCMAIFFILPKKSSWREPCVYLSVLQKNDQKRVLISPALIESDHKEWILDSGRRSYFSAPIHHYLPDVKAIPVPIPLNLDLMKCSLEKSKFDYTIQQDGFYLVVENRQVYFNGKIESSSNVFKNYFKKSGLFLRHEKKFSHIHVLEFASFK
ncbi:glycosyltransferase family 39 protein [bacterium]|nr:glycosyltransferase family 39 protein [bacterium]